MKLEFTKIEEIDYLTWPDNYQEICRVAPCCEGLNTCPF
jgi:hypothetical protein